MALRLQNATVAGIGEARRQISVVVKVKVAIRNVESTVAHGFIRFDPNHSVPGLLGSCADSAETPATLHILRAATIGTFRLLSWASLLGLRSSYMAGLVFVAASLRLSPWLSAKHSPLLFDSRHD